MSTENIIILVLCFSVLLLVLGVLFYLFQHKILFRPEKLPEDFEFSYDGLDTREFILKPEKDVVIDTLHFKSANDKPKGVVFYLKGNTKSIKGWGKFAIDFTNLGWDVVMVDYRGFGKSKGKISDASIKSDIQYVYDKIKRFVNERDIVVYGRSLGTGYASMIAANNNPKMLVLTSPFYSYKKAVHTFLPYLPMNLFGRFSLPVSTYLRRVRCPIKIIHGTNDRLFSFKTIVKLSKENYEKTRLYTILNAGHLNIHKYREYHIVLKEILEQEKEPKINEEKTSLKYDHKKH